MSRVIYSPFSGSVAGTTRPILTQSEITAINSSISDITDDGILSAHEKATYFVPKMNELEQLANALIVSAAEYNISSADLSSAQATHNTYLGNLNPAWDGPNDTPVNRTTLNSNISDLTSEIASLQASLYGNSISPKGIYSAGTTYYVRDAVTFNGNGYVRIGTGPTTGTDPTDGTKWALLVEAGADGNEGADGSPGNNGLDGVDGVDGTDGTLKEFVWLRNATQPTTPTGNGIPSGWSDDPPSGSNPLWMSVSKQELDGTLIGNWSTPIRHDGPPGNDGSDGSPGSDGVDGRAIIINQTAPGFFYSNGVLDPSTQIISFDVTLSGLAGPVSWTTDPSVKSATGNAFSLSNADMGSNRSIVVTATANGVSQTVNITNLADPLARPTTIIPSSTEPPVIPGGIWIGDEDLWFGNTTGTAWERGATVGAQAGVNFRNSTGVVIPEDDVVTSLGIAAGFDGQGELSLFDNIDLSNLTRTIGQLPTVRANPSLQNATLLEQQPSLLPNSKFVMVDQNNFVAGIYPVEGTTTRTAAQQISSLSGGLRITSAVDTTVAYGFPAIPIDDRKIYTLRLRHRSSATSTQGLYLRFNESNNSLSNGRTHVAVNTSVGAHGSQRTSFFNLLDNGAMPGTSTREDSYTYFPTPGTKFASFSMYNWSGFSGDYEVEWVSLSEQGNHELGATFGADWGDSGNISDLPAEGEFIRAQALASMNTGGIGDITFLRNVAGSGAANDGEIHIRGTTFLPPNGRVPHKVNATRREIPTPYEGSRVGYPFFVIYSDESVTSRFSGFWNNTATTLNFFCAEYNPITRQWTARDNSYIAYNFTPLDTDCIVAVCTKRNTTAGIDTLSSLLSVSPNLPTVQRNATGENLYFDNFDSYQDGTDFDTEWETVSGQGNIFGPLQAGDMPGSSVIRIGNNIGDDMRWLVSRTRIPYDPDALYEIEFVVNQRLGNGSIYLGLAGYADDKVTRVNTSGSNSISAQHYIASSNEDLPNGQVSRRTAFFSGKASSGNGGVHRDPADPATLHSNVDFFSPMIIANYNGVPGQLDIGSVRVRKVNIKSINPVTGRMIDSRASYLAGVVGPRSTTNLTPSYTVGGSDVTINLGSHSRKIVGNTGPVTLNYGAGSAVESFSTTWYAYIDDPDFNGDSTPVITLTNNADDLLHAGRYHIASGTTPASNGSGGSSSGGGGSSGGFNDGDPGTGGSIP